MKDKEDEKIVTEKASEVSDDFEPAPPNVMIIGLPKSGSSALFRHIIAHPQFHATGVKEKRALYTNGNSSFPNGITKEEYNSLFIRPSTKMACDASPNYFRHCSPETLLSYAPNAAFILIYRNLVDRHISSWRFGLTNEKKPSYGDFPKPNEIGKFVRRCVDGLGERLLLIDNYDLATDPKETMNRVFNHIGVPFIDHERYKPYTKYASTTSEDAARKKRLKIAARLESDIIEFESVLGRSLSEWRI